MPKPYSAVLMATTMLVIGCGGGGSEPPPGDVTAVEKTSGDEQQGRVGEVLAEPLQVAVTLNEAASAGRDRHLGHRCPRRLAGPHLGSNRRQWNRKHQLDAGDDRRARKRQPPQ